MNWWKRLFGAPRAVGDSPTVDAVRLHLPLPVIEDDPQRRTWRDTDGLVISLDVIEGFDVPTPLTDEAVQGNSAKRLKSVREAWSKRNFCNGDRVTSWKASTNGPTGQASASREC
jgi:hypothetical protein